MRRYLLCLTAILFLVGCQKSSSSNTSKEETNTSIEELNTTSFQNNNPLFYQQWSINHDVAFYAQNNINEDAHIHFGDNISRYNGKGIKVAIIDDGFDVTHPEIQDKIIAQVNVFPNGFSAIDVSHTLPEDVHGTALAGIIAAANNDAGIIGIANGVSLILIKIPMDEYTDAAGIKAFDEAMRYGADVINCSWGTGDVSDAVREKITQVATLGRDGKGTIILFASGNDDINVGNDESSIEEVVGVGATDKENLRTSYSNYGAALDITAPGGEYLGITTIDPLGTNGASIDEYNRFNEVRDGDKVFFTGTSAAAPIATGIIALLLEKNPTLTREEVFSLLASSSDKIGLHVPYVDDIITVHSTGATITGSFAISGMSDFEVRITNTQTSTTIGTYSIASVGSERWEAIITKTLPAGRYRADVISTYESERTDERMVYASDDFYVTNNALPSSDSTKRKNNFYGYGKINIENLLE
jgi:subtilisin family serine protease